MDLGLADVCLVDTVDAGLVGVINACLVEVVDFGNAEAIERKESRGSTMVVAFISMVEDFTPSI